MSNLSTGDSSDFLTMLAEERRKVQKRYKEYDGCYLGHYAQWFFWFFFVLGFLLYTAYSSDNKGL